MNIQDERPYTIFRKDYDNKPYYRIGINKKTKEGKYEGGYMAIRFKGGADIPDRARIYLKSGFLTHYKDREDKTIWFIQALEWELVEDVIKKEHKDIVKTEKTEDPFVEFGKEVTIDDDDLSF